MGKENCDLVGSVPKAGVKSLKSQQLDAHPTIFYMATDLLPSLSPVEVPPQSSEFPKSGRLSDSTGLFLSPVLRKSCTALQSKLTRRLSFFDTRPPSNDGKESEFGKKTHSRKRVSLFLPHTPFPGFNRLDDHLTSRKSNAQLREEVTLLKTLGVKSDSAVPSELHIFKNRPTTHLVMTTFDLWGPNHAKSAFRSMGYSEAFTTIECRDKRESLALESVLSAKFNPRMADDVSTMKALNTPMVRTGRVKSAVRLGKREVEQGKSLALQSILQKCEELEEENRALRRRVGQVHLRRSRQSRPNV